MAAHLSTVRSPANAKKIFNSLHSRSSCTKYCLTSIGRAAVGIIIINISVVFLSRSYMIQVVAHFTRLLNTDKQPTWTKRLWGFFRTPWSPSVGQKMMTENILETDVNEDKWCWEPSSLDNTDRRRKVWQRFYRQLALLILSGSKFWMCTTFFLFLLPVRTSVNLYETGIAAFGFWLLPDEMLWRMVPIIVRQKMRTTTDQQKYVRLSGVRATSVR